MSESLSILIVDDDKAVAKSLNLHIKAAGYRSTLAYSYKEGCELLSENYFDLLISDLRIGPDSGIDLLKFAKKEQQDIDVIIITAYAAVETAIEAMTLGARDYLIKPLNIDELLIKIETIADNKRLTRQVALLQRELSEGSSGLYVGSSKKMNEVQKMIEQVAPTDALVLLEGGSGTGKNVYARYLHERSERSEGPLVSVNCGALPENIIESELFGHKKGAFTGAVDNRKGLFEQADGGTIMLDEIGEMPMMSQPKLLHVLEQNTVRRVGDEREIPINCRVIAATNRNLLDQVSQNSFRQDLYYRLAVFKITLPTLRERQEDIVPLAFHFLEKHGKAMRREITKMTPEAENVLLSYSYPGNIRELENIIQRAIILCTGDTLKPEHLALSASDEAVNRQAAASGGNNPICSLEDMEINHIQHILKFTKGNLMKTSEILGIARSSLWRKMKKYNLGDYAEDAEQ
jgi:DNA-binding NtrC family response regulator